MDDALFVRVGERCAHLLHGRHNFFNILGRLLVKVNAFDVLHYDEGAFLVFSGVKYCDNVGMAELGDGFSFL